MSAEYADQMPTAGTPEKVDLDPVGTGPVPAGRLPEGRGDPLQGPSRLLGRQGADRQPGVRHHARMPRCAGKSCRPANATSCPIPTRPIWRRSRANADLDAAGAGRPERRLSRLQHRKEAVRRYKWCARRSTWRSTSRPSSTPCSRAPARSPRTRFRRPSGPTTTTIKDYPYDPEKAKKLLDEAGVADLKTNIWAMPVQRPYNPNARRMAELIQADWAEGRRRGRDRLLRMGRVSEALQSGRARDRAARLDRRQRRSGQLPVRAARLRCRQGRRQPRPLVLQAVRRPADPGQADQPTWPSAPSSTKRPR